MGFSTVTSSIIIFSSLVISLMLVSSTLLNSWYDMAIAFKDSEELLDKLELSITTVNVSCSGNEMLIEVKNNGPSILWDFYSSDLIVAYVDYTGVKNSYLLSYNVDWDVVYVNTPYGRKLNYTEGMGIYPGESILINATLPSPASLDNPILVVFVSNQGALAYHRWYGGVCYG